MSDPRDSTARTDRSDADRKAQEKVQDKAHLDEMLDEALEETFPASDPVALTPAHNEDSDSPSG